MVPLVLLSVSVSISSVFRCSTELQVVYLCQSPEDFGLRTLPKSSVEHLYADLRLSNTCQIAKGTTMYLQHCLQNSKLSVADTKLRGGKFSLVVSSHRV